jgi:hypothetical protein
MNEITVTFGEETPEGIAAGIAETQAEARIKADKATAKQAVLDKLGLTADEVTALLG